MEDTRSKEQLKQDGDYTPDYWRKLKKERGWLGGTHGQGRPRKRRESTVPKKEGV